MHAFGVHLVVNPDAGHRLQRLVNGYAAGHGLELLLADHGRGGGNLPERETDPRRGHDDLERADVDCGVRTLRVEPDGSRRIPARRDGRNGTPCDKARQNSQHRGRGQCTEHGLSFPTRNTACPCMT